MEPPESTIVVELVTSYSKFAEDHERIKKALALETIVTRSDQGSYPSDLVKRPRVHALERRLSEEVRREIARRYEAGESLSLLMEAFAVSKYVVHKIAEDAGLARQMPRTRADEHELAISLYRDGLSLAEVGRRIGRDPTTVRNILKRAGVPRRDTHGR